VPWNPYPRVPFEAVRDLLAITRALYRATRGDDPQDTARLRALEEIGTMLRSVLGAATTHPGTIAHQNAWVAAERATQALSELVASTPGPARSGNGAAHIAPRSHHGMTRGAHTRCVPDVCPPASKRSSSERQSMG
jgi:hypothetical protein